MKYIILLSLLAMGTITYSQTNTFPSSGNVGIGTTSPSASLDLLSSGNALGYSLNVRNSTLQYTFRVRDDGNWAIGNGASVSGNFAGSIYGGALGLVGTNSSAVYLHASAGGADLKNWYVGASSASFMIRTLNDSYNTLLTPLTINRDGKIGIGAAPNTASILQVRGETTDGSGNVIVTQNSAGNVTYRIENRGFHSFTPTSYNIGNGSLGALTFSQSVTNTTGSNVYSALKLAPTYNLSAGSPTVIGINYEPTETLMTGATHMPMRLGNYLSFTTNSNYTANLSLGVTQTNTAISMTKNGSTSPWTIWTGGTDLHFSDGQAGSAAGLSLGGTGGGSVVRIGSGWDLVISNSRNIVSSNKRTAFSITELSDNSAAIIGVGGPAESNTRMSVRGLGDSAGIAFRVADNANTERMRVRDNGETTWNAGTNEEAKIGTDGYFYPGGSSIRTMYIRNSGSNLLEINGNNTPTLRLGSSSYPTAIRGGNSTINSPVFGVGTSFSAGMGFSNPSSGEVGVTLFYDDNIATKPGFTLSSQGRWGMPLSPSQDDALSQVLVRDQGTGEIKYRSASSLMGSSSLWSSSGANAFYDAGNIGIGVSNPQNKLDVNGTIHAKEVKVDLNGWPDYVFENDYGLAPLSELKKYIAQNKHLPGVPTAKEVEENGVMLGEMSRLLLEKLEETTLYIIELKNQLDQQQRKNKDLESRLEQLESQNED